MILGKDEKSACIHYLPCTNIEIDEGSDLNHTGKNRRGNRYH
jgi:hypothetical protein